MINVKEMDLTRPVTAALANIPLSNKIVMRQFLMSLAIIIKNRIMKRIIKSLQIEKYRQRKR
jgi:hypothetical protein